MLELMKYLIHNRRTDRYLVDGGTWTERPAEAKNFWDISAACTAQAKFQLTDCDLIVQLGPLPSSKWDVVLPLPDELPARIGPTV